MAAKSKAKRPPGRRRGAAPQRRSGTTIWTLGIALAIILGVVLIATSKGERSNIDTSKGTPIAGHWHAAVGIYACGEWIVPHPPELQPLPDPHTHNDGVIHSEPLSRSSAYRNATLGRFAEVGGWDVSENKIELWQGAVVNGDPDADTLENGDKCKALKDKPGVVKWAVNGKVQTNPDPGSYIVEDGDVVTVAFMPEGQDFPFLPPHAVAALQKNNSPVNFGLEEGAVTSTTGEKTSHTTQGSTTTTTGGAAGE